MSDQLLGDLYDWLRSQDDAGKAPMPPASPAQWVPQPPAGYGALSPQIQDRRMDGPRYFPGQTPPPVVEGWVPPASSVTDEDMERQRALWAELRRRMIELQDVPSQPEISGMLGRPTMPDLDRSIQNREYLMQWLQSPYGAPPDEGNPQPFPVTSVADLLGDWEPTPDPTRQAPNTMSSSPALAVMGAPAPRHVGSILAELAGQFNDPALGQAAATTAQGRSDVPSNPDALLRRMMG